METEANDVSELEDDDYERLLGRLRHRAGAHQSAADAQRQGNDPMQARTQQSYEELQIARLMEAGQLSIPDAVKLAENHTKGRAVNVKCDIAFGTPEMANPAGTVNPANPQDVNEPLVKAQAGPDKYLSFDILCVAKDKVMKCRVNGATREVTSAEDDAPTKPLERP